MALMNIQSRRLKELVKAIKIWVKPGPKLKISKLLNTDAANTKIYLINRKKVVPYVKTKL